MMPTIKKTIWKSYNWKTNYFTLFLIELHWKYFSKKCFWFSMLGWWISINWKYSIIANNPMQYICHRITYCFTSLIFINSKGKNYAFEFKEWHSVVFCDQQLGTLVEIRKSIVPYAPLLWNQLQVARQPLEQNWTFSQFGDPSSTTNMFWV
jgi:hypothetical protein